MKTIAYVNLYEQTLSDDTGSELTLPDQIVGQWLELGMRFLDRLADGSFAERDKNIKSLRASIFVPGAVPDGGTWGARLGGLPETADNTLLGLHPRISADALAAAFNDLEVIDTYGTCTGIDGGTPCCWILTFSLNLGPVPITATGNRLRPLSFLRVRPYLDNGVWRHEVRLQCAPIASTSIPFRVDPDAPKFTRVQAGYTDGSVSENEIQRLYIPPEFRGTYKIKFGYHRTVAIDQQDRFEELQSAMDGVESGAFVLSNPEQDYIHFEFIGPYAGLAQDLLEIEINTAPPGDWTFQLFLGNPRVHEAMRGRTSRLCTLVADAMVADADDPPEATGKPEKLFRAPLPLINEDQWDGMEAAPDHDWVRPPQSTGYIPFTLDQVHTGARYATFPLGDGLSTEFEKTHGFDTEFLTVEVWENTETGRRLSPDEYEVERVDNNAIKFTFDSAPDEDEYIAIVGTAGIDSTFQAHSHTIAQVETLATILAGHDEDIAYLTSLIPKPGGVAPASGNDDPKFELPSIGEILPDIANESLSTSIASQVVVTDPTKPAATIGGTDLEEVKLKAEAEIERYQAEIAALAAKAKEDAKRAAEEIAAAAPAVQTTSKTITRLLIPAIGRGAVPGVPASTGADGATIPAVPEIPAAPALWPPLQPTDAFPLLLPAIHDAAADNVTAEPSDFAAAAGKLFRNTHSSAIDLSAGLGRGTQTVPVNGYFGCDGRACYRVVQSGATTSWYALEFQRALFRAIIRPEQFPPSSTLTLPLELRMQLLGDVFDASARDIPHTILGAQYMLLLEAVPITDASSPSTTGANIGTGGTPVELAAIRIMLSPLLETHTIVLELARDAASAGTSQITRYGKTETGATFAAGTFALRGRLDRFDVDDSSVDPLGQVSLLMPSSQLTVTLQ